MRKNISIQKLRGILIFLVIILHSTTESNIKWENYVLIIIRTICNVAVPTFFFLSGYYFNVDKYKKQKDYILKKILRLIIPLVIWNVIYYFFLSEKNITKLILFKTVGHLYFIIVLIQLILLTPIVLKLIESKYIKIVLYSITPIYLLIYRILWIKYNFIIPFHEYYFFGWFIYYLYGLRYKEIKTKRSKHNIKKIYIPILVLCIYNFFIYWRFIFEYSISQMNVPNMIICITILYYIDRVIDMKTRENILSKIGDRSFGIYFLHMIVLTLLSKFLNIIIIDTIILTIIKAFLTLIISFYSIKLFKIVTRGKFDKLLGF